MQQVLQRSTLSKCTDQSYYYMEGVRHRLDKYLDSEDVNKEMQQIFSQCSFSSSNEPLLFQHNFAVNRINFTL